MFSGSGLSVAEMLLKYFLMFSLFEKIFSQVPAAEVVSNIIDDIQQETQFHLSLTVSKCRELDLQKFFQKKISFRHQTEPSDWFYPTQREIVLHCYNRNLNRRSDWFCGAYPCPIWSRYNDLDWKKRILIFLHPAGWSSPPSLAGSTVKPDVQCMTSFVCKTALTSKSMAIPFNKMFLLEYAIGNKFGRIPSPALTAQSFYQRGWTMNSASTYGFPKLDFLNVKPYTRTDNINVFFIPGRNASRTLFFESAGVTLEPGGLRVIDITECGPSLGVAYVYSYDFAVARLAIPKRYKETSLTSVVLSESAWLLILGAILPTAVSCLFVTVMNSERKKDFSLSSCYQKLDIFCDSLFYCIMRFKVSLGSLTFRVKILLALVLLCQFLFLNILQNEMISFARKSRIPASMCTFSRCEPSDVSKVVSLLFPQRRPHHAPNRRHASPAIRRVRACTLHTNKEAYYSLASTNRTVLLTLLIGEGICGKADVLKIQTNSIKAEGLLLEEKLKLRESSTQLCAHIRVPGITQRILEHSLFGFTQYEMQNGFRKPHNRSEANFWASKSSETLSVKNFIGGHTNNLKRLYKTFRMKENDEIAVIRFDSLWDSLTVTVIMAIVAGILFVIEVGSSQILSFLFH